jgi:hypothetical protein
VYRWQFDGTFPLLESWLFEHTHPITTAHVYVHEATPTASKHGSREVQHAYHFFSDPQPSTYVAKLEPLQEKCD